MKKSLLIALAACAIVSANAQLRVGATKAQVKVAPSAKVMGIDNAVERYAEMATPGSIRANGPKKVGANEAKYYRPAGAFYVNYDQEGAGYVMPFLQSKPFSELTFVNASTAPMAGSTWAYQYLTTPGTQDYTDATFEGQDFTYSWGIYQYPDVPSLSIPGVDSAYNCTQGARVDRQTGAITGGPFIGNIFSVVNSKDAFGDEANLLANPHYYGSSNRAYNDGDGWTYYTGAQDQDGGTSAYWFGRNWRGDFNAVGTAVEKPNQPYVLNRVYGYVTALKGTEFPLTVRVYRLDEMPQYMADERNSLDPAKFDDEHLVASGTATVTNEMIADGGAIIPFDLEQYDPEFDMNIQVTPEIDFPIMIVISGYAVDECQGLSFLVTTDEEDEGHGEQAYMLSTAEDGTIVLCEGLNNFFTSGTMTPGMSIFMDVSMPFMVYNFSTETGEYTFPNEGGNYTLAENEGVNIYGIDQFGEGVTAENIYVSLEDGTEVPEWLTITFENGTGELEGTVNAKVTCAALPEDVQGREANVKFYINGTILVYHFIQGEAGPGPDPRQPGDYNNDGQVDIADVNTAIDMMLGKVAQDLILDMNGDGAVDIADINALIDEMLGK